ncbi:hypothetical protein K437DRAFT_292224 [Tilletiaria anomala UBC 951]|uniref:AB hydrolase-1 domain-containing protein n=1 Tax=Tilletiaria anomala (strain ATCC 24038 / CBS 436.72 / UBC 951) TaxID=1037660 RepID=A0A066WLW1_TILAU|nr:uncharacterized protein K437DRAFT_292224 [Tilletiaria anomala UBC 951]KDN53583.1 hypothetical protein K437DRAFT_292224 [Tilletiaria anomala UBC 951]
MIKRAAEPSKDGSRRYGIYPRGKQVDTPLGRINFEVIGAADSKKRLFVHGISILSAACRYDPVHFADCLPLVRAQLARLGQFDLVNMSLGRRTAIMFAYCFPDGIILRLAALIPRKSIEIAKWQVENHPEFLLAFTRSMTQGPTFDMKDTLQATVNVSLPSGDKDSTVPMVTKDFWAASELT